MNIIEKLTQKQLIRPPSWLPNAVQYLCIMGSNAYGTTNDNSDTDIYGFCIPKKELVFPHLAGEIFGFGRQVERFEQFQQHHIIDGDKEYDIQCFSIVKYFQLLMDNNPNMVDSLFVPRECIIHSTQIGELVRENRREFLHKGSYFKFKGYAFSQLNKAQNALNSKEMKDILEFEEKYDIPYTTTYAEACGYLSLGPELYRQYIMLWQFGMSKTTRFENQKIYGADTKFMAHLVRLCDECAQILSTGDLNLRRAKEQVKDVRNGHWTLQQVKDWFSEQEKTLEQLYRDSKLLERPDEARLKALLLQCLEQYFGSLEKCVVEVGKEKRILEQIKELIQSC